MTIEIRTQAAALVSGSAFLAQAARYAVVGTSGTVLYIGAYAAGALVLSATWANVLAWLISTIVCNAAHRRVTFGVEGGESARADAVIGLATSVLGLVLSTGAVNLADAASNAWQVVALLAGTSIGGAARFVLMRWWMARSHRGVTAVGTAAA